MKKLIGLSSVIALLVTAGCVVGPPAPAGVSVGVYGEYPYTYYGGGYYYRGFNRPYYYRPYYYHRPYYSRYGWYGGRYYPY